MGTDTPDVVAKEIENVRNESHGRADGSQDGQGIVDADTGVDWASGNGNAARRQVPGHDKHGKGGRRARLVRIDHI